METESGVVAASGWGQGTGRGGKKEEALVQWVSFGKIKLSEQGVGDGCTSM